MEGQISNIVDFGAFVDLDGIDGLIHISELSWSHVNHPSEVLEIGDTVQVKVLDIDRDRQRISLGLKQTQEDPWQRIVNTYNIGDELAGTVTKVVTFGAFVEILDGVEGLVHISELAAHHVENPREIVQPGDELRVKILEIDSERRRLSLSAKRVEGQVLPVRRIEPEGEGEGDAAQDDGAEAEATAAGESEQTAAAESGAEVSDQVGEEAAAAAGVAEVVEAPSEVAEPEEVAEPVEAPEAPAEPAEPEAGAEVVEAPEAPAEPAEPEAAAEVVEAPEEEPAEVAEPEDVAEVVVEAPAAAAEDAEAQPAPTDADDAVQPQLDAAPDAPDASAQQQPTDAE